MQRSDISWWPV